MEMYGGAQSEAEGAHRLLLPAECVPRLIGESVQYSFACYLSFRAGQVDKSSLFEYKRTMGGVLPPDNTHIKNNTI